MAALDVDAIKDIPGYKIVLKAVLKSQIQHLVETLASHTDEESVIITASVSDGTLSHLGSESGKNFLQDHENVKSQFLEFCQKRYHSKKQDKEREKGNQEMSISHGQNTGLSTSQGQSNVPSNLPSSPRQRVSVRLSKASSVVHTPVVHTPGIRHKPYHVPKLRIPIGKSPSNVTPRSSQTTTTTTTTTTSTTTSSPVTNHSIKIEPIALDFNQSSDNVNMPSTSQLVSILPSSIPVANQVVANISVNNDSAGLVPFGIPVVNQVGSNISVNNDSAGPNISVNNDSAGPNISVNNDSTGLSTDAKPPVGLGLDLDLNNLIASGFLLNQSTSDDQSSEVDPSVVVKMETISEGDMNLRITDVTSAYDTSWSQTVSNVGCVTSDTAGNQADVQGEGAELNKELKQPSVSPLPESSRPDVSNSDDSAPPSPVISHVGPTKRKANNSQVIKKRVCSQGSSLILVDDISSDDMDYASDDIYVDYVADSDCSIESESECDGDHTYRAAQRKKKKRIIFERTSHKNKCLDASNKSIFVRKVLKSEYGVKGQKKKDPTVWNQVHFCKYCKTIKSSIAKHFRTHSKETEVKEVLEMSKKLGAKHKLVSAKWDIIRNEGDHLLNKKTLKNGEGEMILGRRQANSTFKADEYGPCPGCRVWIKLKRTMSLHQKVCPAVILGITESSKSGKEIRILSLYEAGRIRAEASCALKEEVFVIMKNDQLSHTAQNDALIVSLGNMWLLKNVGNKLKRKYYTSQRMRDAARLLLNLKQQTQTDKDMYHYLTPQFFNDVVKASLTTASPQFDDEADLKSPSRAIKLGYDIKRMVGSKWAMCLKTGAREEVDKCNDFLKLMQLEWSLKVSKIALVTLQTRRFNAVRSLPVPDDLVKLQDHVKAELTGQRLEAETVHLEIYRRVVELCQTRLLLYNQRRSGEIEAITVKQYTKRQSGVSDIGRSMRAHLSKLEEHLLVSQELVETRGKGGHGVPVIVPSDTKRALQFISNSGIRHEAGILPDNVYLFPNTKLGAVRAYDSLKKICNELHLKQPEQITSVNMRKYTATISQIFDMSTQEQQWLTNHLGHTMEIHRVHDRQTSGVIERVDIAKLMLLQEFDIAGKYAGKELADIDMQGDGTAPLNGVSDDEVQPDIQTESTESVSRTMLHNQVEENDSPDLPDHEKVLDMDYPQIFVRKVVYSSSFNNKRKKSDRVQNTCHACLYCGKLRSHIQDHLNRKHAAEPEVKTSNETIDSVERNKLKSLLRAKGDDKHNRKVINEKRGELLLFRRPTQSFKHQEFGPCIECYEWMKSTSIPKHLLTCRGDSASNEIKTSTITNLDSSTSEVVDLTAPAVGPPPIVTKPPQITLHQPHATRYMPTPDLSGSLERRSSKRSIKRKRFDDEVVESSLLKRERTTRDRKDNCQRVENSQSDSEPSPQTSDDDDDYDDDDDDDDDDEYQPPERQSSTTKQPFHDKPSASYIQDADSEDDLELNSDSDIGDHEQRISQVLRDNDMPGIFVRRTTNSSKASKGQRSTKKEGNTRVYDNYHACLYCGELRQHISTHMKVHKAIPEVKKVLDSDHPDFTELRKLGDHEHNKKVLKDGFGEIILSRRPDEVFHVLNYGPCESCKEWMMLKNLKRHHDQCSLRKRSKRELIIMAQVEMGLISTNPSKVMLTEVFTIMQRDEVSQVAQKDQTIVALGENCLRRCIHNIQKRKYYSSQHMRLMARVLMEIRKRDGESEKSFSDYLKPRYFDKIVAAVLECCHPCTDDFEDLKSPTNGIKAKHDLKRMLTARWAMLVKEDPFSDVAKEVKTCHDLLNREWGERVTKLARGVMVKRQMTLKRELSSPEDVSKLTSYVTSELKSIPLTTDNFSCILQLAQARILLYNKCRSGEIDGISLSNYAEKTRNLDDFDQSVVADLTTIEKHLLKTQHLMKVKGKANRLVPVWIPEDAIRNFDYLASKDARRTAGVSDKNDYLFPVVGKTETGYTSSYSSLKTICSECSLAAPTRINSVTMRKYISTLTQMLNLDKDQVDWVCRHLGHSPNVHKTLYGQMSDLIERVHITKLLLVQDLNLTSKFKGKKLVDIDVSEIIFPDLDVNTSHEGECLATSTKVTLPEHDSNDNAVDQDIFQDMESDEDKGADGADDEEKKEKSTKPKKKMKRQRWDSEENEEINTYFKTFLDTKITPRTRDVEIAQKRSKQNSGKIWKRSVDKVVKKISFMNHK